jgi:MSHA biogenesis protein MshP
MKHQRGMSLVVAIFLIVVIASLAAFAVTVGTAQREENNLKLMAERAQQAAHAGSEWAAHQTLVVLAANANPCPPPATFNLTQAALRGFRVTVSCTMTGPYPDGSRVFDITSMGQWSNFGASGYVSRTVQSRFIDP